MNIAVCLFFLSWGQTSPSTLSAADSTPISAPQTINGTRSLNAIRKDVSATLKQHSLAEQTAEKARAAHHLVELHREITSDARFAENSLLQEQRGKVWSRLLQIRDEIQRRLAKEKRLPKTAEQLEHEEFVRAIATQYDFAGQLAGGPTVLLARGGGAISYDYGDQLVELIQNTINPATWKDNGGQGTIVYYRPWMALVVRASSSVHEQLGGLLEDVR
jgi:hypothetical protein